MLTTLSLVNIRYFAVFKMYGLSELFNVSFVFPSFEGI